MDDPPLVEKPVYVGGFKHLTHKVIYHSSSDGDSIVIKPTFFHSLLYYFLLCVGSGLLFYNLYLLGAGNTTSFWSTLFGGCILIGSGIVGLLKCRKYEFFVNSCTIYQKKNRIINYVNEKKYKFEQMYSLQVINKLITTGKGISPFRCYELNLVFASGERVNLLHDSELERFKKTVERLSSALNIACNYTESEMTI